MAGSRVQVNKAHKTQYASKSSRNIHKTSLKDNSKNRSERNVVKCARAARIQRNKMKVVQISLTERQNVFSWGRGTNGQLGHGESVDRNIPKMIESLSADGSSGQQIESSKLDPSTGKALVSPIERHAVVPDDNVKRINFAEGKI